MRMGSGGEEQGLQSLRVRIIQVRMIMIMRSWVIIKLMDTIVRMLVKLLIASMLFSKNQGGVIFQLCGQHLSLVTNSYMHLKSQNLLKGILNLLLRKRKFCIRLHKIIKIQIGLSFCGNILRILLWSLRGIILTICKCLINFFIIQLMGNILRWLLKFQGKICFL